MKYIILTLTFSALVLLCVSTAASNWVQSKADSFITQGLWKFCTTSNKCERIDDLVKIDGWYKCIRTLCIFAVLLTLFGHVLTIFSIKNDFKASYSSVPLLLAAFLQFTAVMIFTDMIHMEGIEFGWCYKLGWAGLTVATLAGSFGILADKCCMPIIE